MSIIIKETLAGQQITDILIEGSKIRKIGSNLSAQHSDARIIDGRSTAVLPSFVNAHTHSPMVLLRGAGEDMPLHEWLTTRMWPLEEAFTDEEFYWGNRLAFAEMIRTGTGFFNEMYARPDITIQALRDVPLKAMVHFPVFDMLDEEEGKRRCRVCEEFFRGVQAPENVQLGVALHAVYTVSRYSIEWVRDFTAERNLKIHIHVSETQKEVDDCRRSHDGKTPVEYLESLGLLSDRVLAAHTVHLTDRDIEILAGRQVTVIHNPASNMKLASGVFPYQRLKNAGVGILLGTDGAASNNSLDMSGEMKIAALLQKVSANDSTVMKAGEILEIATAAGAHAFDTGGGAVQSGMEADLMLIDLSGPEMTPLWDLTSSLVYSASGSCVKTLISGGRVLMEDRVIPGYDEVFSQSQKCFERLKSQRALSV